MKTLIDDYDAIKAVVQLYIDGSSAGDRSKLKQAFHPDARMFGLAGGSRVDLNMDAFFDLSVKAPMNTDGSYRARLISTEQFGDAAVAVLAEDGCWGSVSFVDIFTLSRFADTWKIVGKTFAHTGGKMPGG